MNEIEETKRIIEKNWISFMKEMHEWELFCGEKSANGTSDEVFKLEKGKLVDIFKKYCTQKERKNNKPNTISYGSPSSYQYDLDFEYIVNIEYVNSTKCFLYTKKDEPMEYQFLYTLKKEKGQWLFDTKKRRFSDEESWKSVSL